MIRINKTYRYLLTKVTVNDTTKIIKQYCQVELIY